MGADVLVSVINRDCFPDLVEGRLEFIDYNRERFIVKVEAFVEGAVQLPPSLVGSVGVERQGRRPEPGNF